MLFQEYVRTHQPDGEIIFLAANPDVKMKGIGSIGDLGEAAGRTLCWNMGKKVPLTCLLYAKALGSRC